MSTVFYFIRNEYECKFNKINVPVALKYIILSFANRIIKSNILTIKEELDFMSLLFNKMPKIRSLNLLYRGSEHKFSSSKFHELCDNNSSTLCLIKSKFGVI